MRILVVSDLWRPFPGGAEAYVSRVTDALVERGHEVRILTSYAKAKSHHPMTIIDIGVYERHAHGWDVISSIIDGFEYIDQGEFVPDVILTHHFFAGEFANELAEMSAHHPFVEIVHNRQRHPDAALAIFNSQFTADRCGYREGDIVMLPPAGPECVACSCCCGRRENSDGFWAIVCPCCDRQECIQHFALQYDACIGHIKPLGGKGIEMTYKLAQIFRERKFLILRGEWQDGEDIRRLPNVEFMEPVDDIREFWAKCRILLMPSLSEDAGTCPQECALNGIPCISSNVGGLPETNGGGIVLPPDDVEAWITEICKLDHGERYKEVVDRQRAYVAGLKFSERFDEIDRRIRALC